MIFVNTVKYCTSWRGHQLLGLPGKGSLAQRMYCTASISWISPYFTIFLMFYNIVHFIVQHQFADVIA